MKKILVILLLTSHLLSYTTTNDSQSQAAQTTSIICIQIKNSPLIKPNYKIIAAAKACGVILCAASATIVLTGLGYLFTREVITHN